MERGVTIKDLMNRTSEEVCVVGLSFFFFFSVSFCLVGFNCWAGFMRNNA